MKKNLVRTGLALLAVVVINLLGNFLYTRFDLTEDKRFTLSDEAETVIDTFEKPIIVDVLLDGELPPEFAKLRTETHQILETYASKNANIKFNFVDPLESASETENIVAELQGLGLKPAQITVEENGSVSQEIFFPWALVNYDNKTVKVPLLKNKLGSSAEERVNNSVQQLEYAFADAFSRISIKDKKQIAIIKGNGELDDIYIADLLTTLREYYNIGAITLDSVETNAQATLDQLKNYDLAIIAKPTEVFTDQEKYVLDQYMVNGGKSLWLVDQVTMELDSLLNEQGNAVAWRAI